MSNRWLTDSDFFNKYGLPPFVDQDFIGLMKQVFTQENTTDMHALSSKIYTYVSEKMGGFDIDNFVQHGLCDC